MGTLTAAEAGWQKQPFYSWWLTALSKSSKLRPSAKWDSWTPPMLTWLSRLLAPHLPESNPATSHRLNEACTPQGSGLRKTWLFCTAALGWRGHDACRKSHQILWAPHCLLHGWERFEMLGWSPKHARVSRCGVVEQPTPEAGRKEEGQATSQPHIIVYISNRVLVRLRRASVIKRVVTISMHVWSVCSLHCAFGSFALATSFARSLPLSTCPMAVGLACNHFFFITWIEYRICISMHTYFFKKYIYIYIIFINHIHHLFFDASTTYQTWFETASLKENARNNCSSVR